MRHFKTDVSHRIRRRRPSIFTARWFRLVLGSGIVVIMGLAVGPPVLAWLLGTPAVSRSAPVAPAAPPRSLAPRTEPVTQDRPVAVSAPPPAREARAAAPNGAGPVAPPADAPADPAPATTGAAPGKASGPGLFRVQVGAFLDHRNADRLVARLRSEHLEVADSVTEQSRVLYRVFATPKPGEGLDGLLGQLQGLGFTPELTGEGAAVTAPVPLSAAIETSRALREQGLRVRLERQASSAAFRVVRVGAFVTAEDAERARADLSARGFEGFVVRER
jgi:cell division septation protein DedD